MTYLTIFGFNSEGADPDTILLHTDADEAQARGREWLEEETNLSYDYMKIMSVTDAGASEVDMMRRRSEWE